MNYNLKKVTLIILSLILTTIFFVPFLPKLPKFKQQDTFSETVSNSSLVIQNPNFSENFSENFSYEITINNDTTSILASTAKTPSSFVPISPPIDYSDISDITTHTLVLSKKELYKNLIVIGDVHGCIDDLERLLKKLRYNPRTDYLIFTGDLITRGPDSLAVIQKVRELGAISVRGNHEEKLIKWKRFLDSAEGKEIEENDLPEEFKLNNEHYKLAKSISKKDFEFLRDLPLAIRISEPVNTIIVHGGLDPARFTTSSSLRDQDPWVMMNVRNIGKDGTPLKKKRKGRAWAEIWNEHMARHKKGEDQYVVVYGHDAGRGLKIRKWSKGLDTGCVYGRRLTAYRLSGKRAGELTQVHC